MKRSDYLSDLVKEYSYIPCSEVETIIKSVEKQIPIPKGLDYLVRSIQYYRQLFEIEQRFIDYKNKK